MEILVTEDKVMWTIVLRYKKLERAYEVEAKTRYKAVKESLKSFIEEFELPGTPTEYWYGNTREGEIEIQSKSSVDRRRADW